MKLDQSYNRPSFYNFLDDFLPSFVKDTREVTTSSKLFTKVTQLGMASEFDLVVFEISLDASVDKRIAITTDAFKIMKQYQTYRALIVFRSEKEDLWRLSLMTSTPTIENGKVITKLSNPRRYSYQLGPNAKTSTPHRFLIKNGSVIDFADLQKRFSVEVVNNEFYGSIAKLYDNLVGVTKSNMRINIPGSEEQSHQFAVRLIGRIVFCWFLREKHSLKGSPLIGRGILSSQAAEVKSYYNKILAPLFFEVLNKPVEKRSEKFKAGDFGQVPYLNGGLFSPQYEDYYKFDNFLGQAAEGKVDVPDEWLRDFFDLLETYHFTVDENTSVDIDLSIDPEMLGRIFENLLARINPETGETVRKTTGSFYTPREIVEYMVDESIVQYLKSSTDIDEDKLRALISYDLTDDSQFPLNDSDKKHIVRILGGVKILDPACGSGAFPIGILQKIVFVLQQIDTDAQLWFDDQIMNTPPELRHLIEREFKHKNFDYIRKLGIIRESIFGVDIQPIATEIARLRCFLTLIVDERVDDDEPNRGVYPLPNLDFKFVTANTLVKLDIPHVTAKEQTGLFEDQTGIGELKQLRDDYFNSHNSERDSLKLQFSQAQNRMLQNMIANHSHGFADVTQKLSSWDPFSYRITEWFDSDWMFGVSDGFDIVIGNPPYFQLQKNKRVSEELAPLKYDTFSKSSDIYCVFFERGIQLLQDKGILTYITSNSWIKTKYGQSLRKLLVRSANPLVLINFDDSQIFNTAIVESNILVVKKDSYQNELRALSYSPASNSQTISEYFNDNYIHIPTLHDTGWIIGSAESAVLRDKLESQSKPLKEYNQNIYIGLLNGYNDAYVIDTKTRDLIVSKDPKSADIIKPMLRGRDVRKYGFTWSGMWMINTHNGIKGKLPRIDVERDYPSIYHHLLKYRHKLEVRQNKGDHWTNLRNCAYFQEFDKPKIVWGELSDKPKFAYDDKGYIAEATLFAMVTGKPMFLLGILNSKLALWYFEQITTSSGMGTSRWKKYKIEQLPICIETPEKAHLIRDLEQEVTKLTLSPNEEEEKTIEKKIDSIVYALYNLTPNEIELIENTVS